MKTNTIIAACLLGLMFLGGCGFTGDDAEGRDSSRIGATNANDNSGSGSLKRGQNGKGDSSVEAVFLEFAFDGSVHASSAYSPERRIEDQLLYTVGQLNGDKSVGRVDKLELSEIAVTDVGSNKEISYHAEMLVAWGKRDAVPSTYTFRLPKDLSWSGRRAFVESYGERCVDWGADDVDSNSMWYYYRPNRYRCQLQSSDIVEATASVTPSAVQTTGKYPEYHRVWKDDVLQVTAVFGKYKAGATSSSDAGIRAYNEFVGEIRRTLRGNNLTTVPENAPRDPGVNVPEITFRADLGEGKTIEVHAFLVDGVKVASRDFYNTYAQLSRTADLIAYNGHSGLGSNIRELARKGDWRQGQYSIVFMNGCDTYAYVDSALADAHARVNPDDPNGTKYLDLVMNAMPAYFHETSDSTMALIEGLMRFDDPVTFEHMFRSIDSSQVVLVSGEQDNVYVPGMDDSDPDEWAGFEKAGTVRRDAEKHFETPTVPAGRYRFELRGTNDADLYVRIGERPTVRSYDCRPYRYGSRETCVVDVPSPAPIHVVVRGWAYESDFTLTGALE